MTQFGPPTSSLSTPVNFIPSPQLDYMSPALYKAARDGDSAPFNQYQGDLSCLFAGGKNTALHIYCYTEGRHLADRNEREREFSFIKLLVYKCPSLLLQPNVRGEIPLHIAANRGDSDMSKILIELAKEESVKELIEANRPLTRESDAKGRTPLHYAVYGKWVSLAKLLLQSDASAAYITDKERGITALHLAAWGNTRDIMEAIIFYCPGCCEIVDKRKWNFLHYAVVSLHLRSLQRFLIGFNSKDLPIRDLVNEKDVNGNTPFHLLMFRRGYVKGGCGWNEYDQVVEFFKQHICEEYESGSLYPSSQMERKKQIQQLLKDIANDAEVEHLRNPNINDIVLKVQKEEMEMKVQYIPRHEIEEKAREYHLLVATLVATVTFTAAFTIPGGQKEQQGTATLIRDSAFRAFIISNTLAFVASVIAITFHFISVTFHGSLRRVVTPILTRRADQLTLFAIAAMVVAFSTGTYTVLQSSPGFAITALMFGLVFFPICVALFLFDFICSQNL